MLADTLASTPVASQPAARPLRAATALGAALPPCIKHVIKRCVSAGPCRDLKCRGGGGAASGQE